MQSLLFALAALWILGVILLASGWLRAPLGSEDVEGFAPATRDLSGGIRGANGG